MLWNFRPSSRWWLHERFPLPGDTGEKDSLPRAIAVGVVLPACIVALAAFTVFLGRIHLPSRYSDGWTYVGFWPVTGAVLVQLGAAAVLVAWYGLANFQRTEAWCHPVGAAGLLAAAVGIVVFVAAALL